ncbi:MAG: SPFH domain-containing protein [Atopobium sp.]|uniref:SPFH domain-containing protein n=1 Tax=Atopobium sp. TaxID=1872650 RepID=UPI002A8304A2|nr:SPFH domain-containing protein [Atopobium sp.]MDY4522935.1 SPFH domain-containing protein [Atopobium sp.]
MSQKNTNVSVEKELHAKSGWLMLVVTIVLFLASVLLIISFISDMMQLDALGLEPGFMDFGKIFAAVLLVIAGANLANGFFSLQPGQARVCVLFGDYIGTVRDTGFRWANPFYAKSLGEVETVENLGSMVTGIETPTTKSHKSIISVRERTLNGERIKVNDRMGNPIEIATVVVWHVADTAKALFDVDDYESYVSMQAETALRHVASVYAYDHMEDDDNTATSITLRTNIEEVSDALQAELENRLAPAGVAVSDARLTHLAYASEIAQAMLRRQQAEAVIAARKKIVEGAVSMVDMALRQLSRDGIVEMDEERKATMASNLMVVLCGESEAQPVLNTGSLY